MRQKVITLFVIIFLSSMLIFSVVIISVPAQRLHVQVVSSSSSPSSTSPPPNASGTQGLSKIHGVKIVSPLRGQKVPVEKNLTIIGTSIANSTSHCIVSVSLNGIKPYQRAVAAGPNGTNDYSLWGFILTPRYAAIKAGANQLKAKFSCIDDPTLVSYYTTNITGVATSSTTAATPITSAARILTNKSNQLKQ